MSMTFIDELIDFLDQGQISVKGKNNLELYIELINSSSINLELVEDLKTITFANLIDNIDNSIESSTELFKNTEFPYSNFLKNYFIFLDKTPSLRKKYAYI